MSEYRDPDTIEAMCSGVMCMRNGLRGAPDPFAKVMPDAPDETREVDALLKNLFYGDPNNIPGTILALIEKNRTAALVDTRRVLGEVFSHLNARGMKHASQETVSITPTTVVE